MNRIEENFAEEYQNLFNKHPSKADTTIYKMNNFESPNSPSIHFNA